MEKHAKNLPVPSTVYVYTAHIPTMEHFQLQLFKCEYITFLTIDLFTHNWEYCRNLIDLAAAQKNALS